MSDQRIISPHNINNKSSRQDITMKKNINQGNYQLIQYQIPRTNVIRIVWQTVKRVTSEILA